MRCTVCHHGDTQPGTTTVTFASDRRTIVVTQTPADVCENCGEPYIAEEVTSRLLDIAHEARRVPVQVLVRNFAGAARNAGGGR